ncbi:carbonic anhydrase [Pontibacter ramchanderi]|uniref:Carbonic anhydrase n=1 Tax=Pontibacter ramchanderi TaxID=1179743 RepID=A0A2N3V3Q9_9BACT|nr:carbonic anhydrase [Pontibacter ramchanderi]PKV76243.1 carbonic anhydrase [Pontibacter ramchanderi]
MQKIFENNRKWVAQKLNEDKDYFNKLAMGQKPRYLYIGCSDSRIPINEVTGTGPGEIFVHRNIANMVVHTDMNLLSVLQYAVEVLKVKDIIVCGHYGCGGVAAAASNKQFGMIDNWLRNIKDVIRLHEQELMSIEDEGQRQRRLVELNITEQVLNLSKTSIIQNAMQTDDPPKLYGLVYDLKEGLLRDLNVMEQENSIKRYEHIYSLMEEKSGT